MMEPERPPLNPVISEQIEQILHRIDQRYWAILRSMRVARFIAPSVPIPPRLPEQMLNHLRMYAVELLTTEADSYSEFVTHGFYPAWIHWLEERTSERVLAAVKSIEDADPNLTLGYHGLDHYRMVNEIKGRLWEAANPYRWKATEPATPPVIEDATPLLTASPQSVSTQAQPERPRRMSASIHSPSAARKVEAFIEAKGIGLTNFATSAGLTDRTLRSFRKTGRIRRSLLDGIAQAMGTTREELLRH